VKHNLDTEYQILLRRCPVDISGRFDAVVSKYPDLIKQAPPLWNFEPNSNWTTIYPLPEDVKLLVSTSYYSDVVLNLGSTMAFDFGMFHKPCIYIDYDQKTKVNTDWSVKIIYKFQHFKSMPNKNVVIWWQQKEEIKQLLLDLKWNEVTNIWIEKVLEDYDSSSAKVMNSIIN